MNKIKIFGVHLQRWHLYFIIPLLCLLIAGCAAGLLLVGTALSGSSGESSSSGSSVQRRVSGLVFSQGSENVIAPLGGAQVVAEWDSTKSILGAFTKAVVLNASTTTNSDGSYELDGIDDNADVVITIEKDGHTTQVHNVNTAGTSPSLKGTLNRKNQNKKTIFATAENDVNTDEDVNEKGEAIPRCHMIITSGAVAGNTEVELSPYYSLDNLPQPIPDGYIGLAGADFSAASTVLFTTNKEAKPYIVLPSYINYSELSVVNIKLMELIETGGVWQWTVSKNAINQDRACKYYSSGSYQGMLGPDDDGPEDNRAKLKGIRPFCFVYATTQLATIRGTVRNITGTAIAGAMVFGGGSAATTDLDGDYSLERVIALSANSTSLIMVNAIAPGYELAYAVAAVTSSGTASNINITLMTLYEVAILGGKVTDTATTLPIAGAKVVCATNPYIAAFVYDNKGTATDFTDDVLSVTSPANLRYYRWYLTDPNGERRQSSQTDNWALLNSIFQESGFENTGSYRADLGITMTDERTVTATAGLMSKLVYIGGGLYQRQITDIQLPVSMDPSITMEAYSNTVGNYRMIGVPSGVELKLQASKSGYQSSGIRTLSPLTQGETAVENFSLNPGSAAVASIWITPAPSVNLQNGQTVQFSGVARDEAENVISPTPVFTWTSSNPAIASINSSGLASAQGSGNITIEASYSGITSNAVTVQVGGLPAAPSNFTANAVLSSQIDLAWQDNSSDEDLFEIERSTNGITYTVISTQYPDTEAYNDTGLSANTQYWYRVYSHNANGYSSKASATATTPGIPVPTGPTNLTLTVIDAYTINLTWTDNSNNENGFQIRRSSTGDEGSYGVIDTVGANATFYQNIGLTPKSYYYYRVYAYNDSGNSTTYAAATPPFVQTPDTIPTAPSGLVASTTSSSQINLNWTDASNNESGFRIERSLESITWTEITTTTANTAVYTNTGLTYNTTYYYRVRSYNTAGNSGYTTVAYATTSQSPPSDPTGATIAVLSDISIRINWTDTSDNEDSFKVQRSTDGASYPISFTVSANTNVYTNTGLAASTLYYYRVYAYNTAGNSGYSDVVSGTTDAPHIPITPTNLVANPASDTQINLYWTDNSYNEDNFRLDRAPDVAGSPGAWDWVITPSANATTSSDTGLVISTTYWYRILAYNVTGDSDWSNVVSATTEAPPIPNAPSGISITAISPNQINTSWVDASNNEDGFKLERSLDGSNWTVTYTVNANVNSYPNTGLNGDTIYYYRVSAYNITGISGYSGPISTTTPPEIPTAPTALTAAAISPTAITISWTDTSNNETGFKIERFISGSYQEIATTTANTAVYTNTGLTGNTLYYYKVRAYNVTGNSDYSNIASATTPIMPPDAPDDLITTTVTASQISLQWDDNSTNEESFKLERSTNGTTYTLRTTLAAGTNTFDDTGLSENTPYWYRVYAYNGGGSSTNSNVISATTLLPLPYDPSGMTATAVSSSQINLNWTDTSYNETGFKPYRSPNGSAPWTALTQTAAGVTNLSDINLTPNTTYYYRVCAYNATGDSGYSPVSGGIQATTFEVIPNAPGAVTATAVTPYQIVITWTDTSNNETGFKVERKVTSYSPLVTPTAGTTSYTDDSVSPNTTYYYKVRAYNGAGNSAFCTEMIATTAPPPTPTAPSNLITTTVTSSSIGLQWQDTSDNELGFKIERKITSGNFTYLDLVAANITTYNNAGLTSGITYTYQVYAYNGGGNSGFSNPISATTLIVPPNAPEGLITTTVTSSSIGIQWQDKSNDETKFYIERSTAGSWTAMTSAPATVQGGGALCYPGLGDYIYALQGNFTTAFWRYSISGNSWTSMMPAPNTVYWGGALVYPGTGDFIYAFRGYGFTDFWRYSISGNSWTSMTTAPNPVANGGALVYPGTGDFIYALRGNGTTEFWRYSISGNTWATRTSTPATVSSGGSLVYPGSGDYIYAFRGTYTDFWRYSISGNSWVAMASAPAIANAGGSLVYPGTGDYIYAFQGSTTAFWRYSISGNFWGTIAVAPDAVQAGGALVYPGTGNYIYAFQGYGTTAFWRYSILSFSYFSEVGANVVSYTNNGLPFTTIYWYRVYAWNTAGPSGFSNVISATTLGPPPPNAPTNLIATAQAFDRIQLNWTDKSGDEDGFRVYRSTDGITYTLIATPITNTTIYSDMPVSHSVTYWYTVKAYNTYGESGAAGTTGIIAFQSDAMIRLSSDPDDYPYYLTNNFYESTPVSQTKSQNVESRKTVSYYIRVQNDGNLTESFRVTGTGSSGNWTVTYYDVTYGEPGVNITWSMTDISGYATSYLGIGSYITIRMEVSQAYAQTGSYYDTVVRVASISDPTKSDIVKARTEAIPSYYSISGDVSYGGFMTGQIYLSLNYSGGGEPGVGTSIPAVGPFTIRGVQPGEYYLNAWMDHLGSGVKNAGNPNFSLAVSVTSSDVYGVPMNIYDPVPTPTPSTPDYIQVFPSDSSGLAFFDTPKDGNGREIADSYCVYWHTSPTVSKSIYLGYKIIPANQDNAAFIDGLVNGFSYYFVVTALVGADESSESSTFGPLLIGPATGNYNVSGTIFYPGVEPTGPLYVGVYNESGGISFTRIAFPAVGSQTYSLGGVANGDYMLFVVLDMNNNGLIDAGDCKDTESGPMITVNNADLTDQNKTLPTGYGTTKVETEHSKLGTDETYRVNLKAYSGRKLVVAVAVTSGSGVTSVIDIDKRDREFRYELNRGSNRPITSDNYSLLVTYSDATTETLNAPVTAVLDCFARNLSPTTVTGGHVVPTFTWSAPAAPPASYSYYMYVNKQNGGDIWRYPDKNSMPSSQLSALYNVDGRASQSNLDIGTVYYWYVMVIDSNNNKVSQGVSYSPTYFDNQADAMIGASTEPITSYLTDNLYETYPISQTKTQYPVNGQTVSYLIRVQNEGAATERFTVTGTGSAANWVVTYYEVPTGTNITSMVTITGFLTSQITSTGYVTIRLDVKPISVSEGAYLDNVVTAMPQNASSKKDVVKATTRVPISWKQVAAGSSFNAVIKNDNSLWVWGSNGSGQLGLGNYNTYYSPTRLGAETNWKSVSAGNEFSAAVKYDGSLWVWGNNSSGQLGQGDTSPRNVPTRVGTGITWTAVACGYDFVLALNTDNTLWSWGSNWTGQLGLGDTSPRYSPVKVGTDINWTAIDAANCHSLMRKSDGTIWSCGMNADGRLGLNDTSPRYAPTKIGTDINWQKIDAGENFSLAIKTDGSIWSWGYNSNYQLGLNDTNQRLSPVRIGAAINWKTVSGGYYHTIATKTDGTLWVWGYNSNGQLGLGDYTTRTVPVQLGSETGWDIAKAGWWYSLSLKTNKTLWSWGENGSGQLGLGDWSGRTTPNQVPNQQ